MYIIIYDFGTSSVKTCLFKSMKSAGGQMKLLNIGPNFHEVLYITGLDAVFKVK